MTAHPTGQNERQNADARWRTVLKAILEWPPIHQSATQAEVHEAWGEDGEPGVEDRRARAHRIIKERIDDRGRSMGSTLVFAGFLVAAEVALLGYGSAVGGFRSWAVTPCIPALLAMFWGMLPSFGALFPRFRGKEAVEALEATDESAYYEKAGRSSSQRTQLWRLRVGMTISLLFAAIALLLFA